jgi:hypothetical protein
MQHKTVFQVQATHAAQMRLALTSSIFWLMSCSPLHSAEDTLLAGCKTIYTRCQSYVAHGTVKFGSDKSRFQIRYKKGKQFNFDYSDDAGDYELTIRSSFQVGKVISTGGEEAKHTISGITATAVVSKNGRRTVISDQSLTHLLVIFAGATSGVSMSVNVWLLNQYFGEVANDYWTNAKSLSDTVVGGRVCNVVDIGNKESILYIDKVTSHIVKIFDRRDELQILFNDQRVD